MTPYYDDPASGITIYHGDCRDVLPLLDRAAFSVLIADPPYGYSHKSGRASLLYGDVKRDWNDAQVKGDDSLAVRDAVLDWWGDGAALIFGSWKIPAPAGTKAVLVWDKGGASGMGNLAIPWKPSWELIYVLGSGFSGKRDGGVLRHHVPPRISMGRVHPTQKPVNLMRELLQKCPPGNALDPCMGSGPSLVAARELGRRAIGIELEERYCEIAAKRLQQAVLPLAGVA